MLDAEAYHDPSFKLQVGDTIYSTCPIVHKDNYLVGNTVEAYKILESRNRPEDGAYGDQPVFWAVVSQRMKNKVSYYEQRQLEEHKERAALKR